MEQIRAWALSVCFACIAAGIVQQLSASRARFSVIKLVLTLYILITAFAPLKNIGETQVFSSIPDAGEAAQTVDTQALVLEQAAHNLEQTLLTSFSAKGISVESVHVTLSGAEGAAQIESVAVRAPESAGPQEIEALVCDALGAGVPVSIEKEG